MIGKLIGAVAGAKLAEQARVISGPTGALLGVAVVTVIKRMSPLTLVAALAGGYLAKRYVEKQSPRSPAPATTAH